MGVVIRTVFRQLLRVLRTAQAEGIPVTGCVALPHFTHILCPAEHIISQFRQTHELDGAYSMTAAESSKLLGRV